MERDAAAEGLVVWVTGRPQSGKSTFAARLAAELRGRAIPTILLDGDEVRDILVPKPGYDDASRESFYATLAGLAGALCRQGFVVVVPATAHLRKFRARARELCADRYLEVHVAVSEAVARERDQKGLYESADAGRMPSLPSAGAAYEDPESADVVASGGLDDAAVRRAVDRIAERRG